MRGLWPQAHTRLMRQTRWRLALRASLLVMAVLGALSVGAYFVARGLVYGRLREGAHHSGLGAQAGSDRDDRSARGGGAGRPASGGAGSAALHPAEAAGSLLEVSSRDAGEALHAFLLILGGLTLAGGAVALPAGYLLAARALLPLDQAVRERSEFVALASHRLRTPLAVIRTAGELALAGQGLQPAEALETIIGQAQGLEHLAQRLTALSRAEVGSDGGGGPTDARQVARAVAAALEPAAQQRGVRLHLLAGPAPRVRAGEADVADLLSSVVENAVRHAPPGSEVTLRLLAAGRRVTLEVADRGPGIDPALLPRVMRPFVQGAGVRGGTGLGLAIAAAIAQRLRGRIELASAPGRGTTVRITLPAVPRPRPRPP